MFVLESLICCPSWFQIQNPPPLNWGLILQAYGTMPCLFFYICILNRNHWEILGMGALRTYASLMLFTPGVLSSPLLQAPGHLLFMLTFPESGFQYCLVLFCQRGRPSLVKAFWD